MPYIGKSPTGSGVRQRYHFTATGGETSLSGADDNSKTLKFTDGEYVDVYLNGILLVQGTDYGVGTANTISSLAALSANDIVEVVVYDIFNVAKINSEAIRARHYFTATGGETSIGTSQIAGLSFAANADIDVSLNGISLVAGTDYNTTTANTVGGLSALTAGQVVEIVIYEKFQLADALSKAAGGNIGGALGVGTIKDATGTTTAMTIDSTGRILTPARPAFFAYLASSQALNSVSEINITQYLTTIDFNIGGHYSAADGFVAPTDGIYCFQFGFYTFSTTNAEISIYKNGSKFQRFANTTAASAVNPYSTRSSTTLSLSSGDEIELYHSASTATLFGSANRVTFFSGFLVG